MYKAYKVPTETENNSDKPDIRSGPTGDTTKQPE